MADKTLLGVFAHPDDETSCAAALMKRYAGQGVDIHIVTATRGEMGALGTGGLEIKREDLPKVREAEQKKVLQYIGVTNPPVYLDYKDQDVDKADFEEAVVKVLDVMSRVQPDVIIAFGPTGLSNHPDHIAMHKIATEAFERHRAAGADPRLLYWAIPKEALADFELEVEGIEVEPNVIMDVTDTWSTKIECLRLYKSQEDAQEIAEWMEGQTPVELFHQVHPPVPDGVTYDDLFHD